MQRASWQGGWQRLSGAARMAAHALFPPTCPSCGRLTGRHGAVCASCWSTLALLSPPWCAILGRPFSHDLGEGAVSAEAIADPPDFDRLRSAVLYDGAARPIVTGLKYRDRTELAGMMAGLMVQAGAEFLARADVIVPVPLHRLRLFMRTFNQAGELARALSNRTGIPLAPAALLRRRRTSRQVGLGAAARKANLSGAFTVSDAGRPDLVGRHVVLIDDVYTTGATANAAARALRRAGAAEITVLTFAMTPLGDYMTGMHDMRRQ